MPGMQKEDLYKIREDALSEVASARDTSSLETIRSRYFGRKGLLQEIMKGLGNVPKDQRPEFGSLANTLKTDVLSAVKERQTQLQTKASTTTKPLFDYSLPGQWRGNGFKHPLSIIIDRVVNIFQKIGFVVAEGPDVEDQYHNFDALNTPKDHPARNIHDTFFLDDNLLLRTHTSPVQIRYMRDNPPPVRIVAPGRCYRRDTPDATHTPIFHQIEGLYVDKKVSMSQLKGDLSFFAKEMMGRDVKTRLRPHFFPFTEPSVEVDFSCHACSGKGCRICKNKGWIEIAGAGMVDPNVFKSVGYDPEIVSGYAFGFGIERIAMLLYRIDDIRTFYDNDARILRQFVTIQ